MALDDELDGRMSRRSFLEGVGKAALGLGVVGLGGCKSPAGPSEPEPDFSTDAYFKVYNHMRGEVGEYRIRDVMTSSSVSIDINDLGVGGVDNKRIVVRGPLNDCGYVAYGNGGGVDFVLNKFYEDWGFEFSIFLLDGGVGSEEYDKIDNETSFEGYQSGFLRYGHDIKWKREDVDGLTGPDGPLLQAVAELNRGLDAGWLRYGRFSKVGSDADISIGYGDCHGASAENSPTGHYARVNPEQVKGYGGRLLGFTAEVFELTNGVDDLGGRSSYNTICDSSTGLLNDVGKALACYVHAKDRKSF